jgi:hypothetical protein
MTSIRFQDLPLHERLFNHLRFTVQNRGPNSNSAYETQEAQLEPSFAHSCPERSSWRRVEPCASNAARRKGVVVDAKVNHQSVIENLARRVGSKYCPFSRPTEHPDLV